MTVHTVDVSHHDWDRAGGRIDWAAVARSGIVAASVRMTYGDPSGYSPASRHGRDMARGARAAGLITGGYHNLVRGDSASIHRQVDWLRSEMDAAGATWAMVDVERYPELLSRHLEPRISDVRAFFARWREVDHRPLLVYLPRWVWAILGSPDLRGLGCPLVASDYGSNSSGSHTAIYSARGGDSGRGWGAYGGVVPTLWQYGSRARVPGLTAQTDVNAYRGELAALRALLTGPREKNDMAITDADAARIAIAVAKCDTTPWDTTDSGYTIGGAARDGALSSRAAVAALTAIRADLAEALGRDPVDEQEIADAVLAKLTPEAIAERIVSILPANLAQQVITALGEKLRAP